MNTDTETPQGRANADTDRPAPVIGRRALRIKEFCEAYGVSRTSVYRLMDQGKLRTVLVLGRRLIPVEAAEALMAGG